MIDGNNKPRHKATKRLTEDDAHHLSRVTLIGISRHAEQPQQDGGRDRFHQDCQHRTVEKVNPVRG